MITDEVQRAVVDVLNRLEVIRWDKDIEERAAKPVLEVIKRIEEDYNLEIDPFTHFVCTTKDYIKNSEEYDRQLVDHRNF